MAPTVTLGGGCRASTLAATRGGKAQIALGPDAADHESTSTGQLGIAAEGVRGFL